MNTQNTLIVIAVVISFFGLCLTPHHASAAAPPNVQSVSASIAQGLLTVHWQSVNAPEGIAFYRIYFSRESILNNGGNYDDFERTTGNTTSYTFQKNPFAGRKVFVSVMAVNTQGEESAAFLSEASVNLPSDAASVVSSSQASSSAAAAPVATIPSSHTQAPPSIPAQTPLSLLEVTASSATGVTLRFSKDVSRSVPIMPGQFLIVDGSGTKLNVAQVSFSGSTSLVLQTDTQTRAAPYILGLLQGVVAADGSAMINPLPQFTFFGFMPSVPSLSPGNIGNPPAQYVVPPPPAASSAPAVTTIDTTPPESPTALRLRPSPRKDGTYSVDAVWKASINTAKDLSNYVVYTTVDGHQFFPGQTLSSYETRAHIGGVQPGTFGVRVTAKDGAGNESAGADVITTLPHTGIGLLGVFAVSGALAGRSMGRRRRTDAE